MSASVIVCAYNEGRHISRCLQSIIPQLQAEDELVVVDDGSTDGTADLAWSLGVPVIRVPHRGPALARNAGAVVSSKEALVFVDGDMTWGDGYLDAIVGPIEANPACSGTFTRDLFVGWPDAVWSTAYSYIRRLPHPRVLSSEGPDRSANYRAVRRVAFEAVGGYDDVGYGEDMTLAPKLGALAWAVTGARVDHFNPDSPSEIFENAKWIGRGFDVREVRHPIRDNLPSAALRRAWRDRRSGAPLVIYPARLIYSVGFLVGFAKRSRNPRRHWK
jgi:glycosyltransferase involved in cell wall biosynthesis